MHKAYVHPATTASSGVLEVCRCNETHISYQYKRLDHTDNII
jgi:hypothetical protein